MDNKDENKDDIHTTTQIKVIKDELAEEVKSKFIQFLDTFKIPNQTKPKSFYYYQVEKMRNNSKSSLYIDFNHLEKYNKLLSRAIQQEYYRLDNFIKKSLNIYIKRNFSNDPNIKLDNDDVEDDEEQQEEETDGDNKKNISPDLKYKQGTDPKITYTICFYNVSPVLKIRDLRTSKIGTLCTISGTVTRTSEIRPELILGKFYCMDCSTSSNVIPQQFKYTEPAKCLNPLCENTRRWRINMDESTFIDWQKVRIQENSSEIPSGSMPRSLEIILRGDSVESARAGDRCIFVGTMNVVPDVSRMSIGTNASVIKGIPNSTSESGGKDDFGGVSGLKDLGVREMNYKICFFSHSVKSTESKFGIINSKSDDMEIEEERLGAKTETGSDDADDEFENTQEAFFNSLSEKERQSIEKMRNTTNLYTVLAKSIAPSVFGHMEVKRGILLMLFGGVHKKTPEKIRLRGDINVCVVGDPSTSKSSFLKYLVSFLPRTVYTSGKASSAAGLTATVVRDPESGDFNIEAGALMLADNGICCIDEFDKMDISDQIAIHEAMEQQTISIAKAGIHATLNARTSILAAANPIGGRYDVNKSLSQNLNIGGPLMSRFDLFYIVRDECSQELDKKIAEHIVSVHQKKEKALKAQFTQQDIKNYIKYSKYVKPLITPESAILLEEHYRDIRSNDKPDAKASYRITVRQLESMIRLSEALARLNLDPQVKPYYVNEASRLLQKSIIHTDTSDIDLDYKSNETVHRKIGVEKFYSLVKEITLFMKSEEEGIKQIDIVNGVIKLLLELKVISESQVEQEAEIISLVLDILIVRDRKIFILGDNNDKNERYLCIHPNQ